MSFLWKFLTPRFKRCYWAQFIYSSIQVFEYMNRNSFDENKVVTMLISKMMNFHYLNSMCQSYHFEYPLASYEKRMPQLPIIKDITEFLDNVILHRPHHDSQTKKRDSSGAERSFFQQLIDKILSQHGI